MTTRPRAGTPRRPAAAALLWAAVALLATAWPAAGRADTVDPAAFAQVDPEAPDLEITGTLAVSGAEVRLVGRRLLRDSEEIFLPSAAAASLFQARRDWRADQRRLAFRAGGHAFELTAGSRLVAGEAGETLLRLPPVGVAGDLWVPMEFLTRVVGPATGGTVAWDPRRLRIEVGGAGTEGTGRQDGQQAPGALPEPTPLGRIEPGLPPEAAAPDRPLEIRTVVIDPGHGGDETGRVGVGGTLEKDLNLAVARELARYLDRRGLRVKLTREGDEAVPLARRAEFANQEGGDLFVSLHCNGWFHPSAAGVETYFLSPAKTDREASVASVENAAGEAEDGDVSFILWDLVQNGFIRESSDLAESIQAALCEAVGAENRGVKQAGFRVLVGAYMPAVLVELGFLSNEREEARLNDGEHQRLLARAMGDAILAFRDRHRGGGRGGDDEGSGW